jgi:hypothetical protein
VQIGVHWFCYTSKKIVRDVEATQAQVRRIQPVCVEKRSELTGYAIVRFIERQYEILAYMRVNVYK